MDENPDEQLEAIIPDEELDLEPALDDSDDVEALKEQVATKDKFARQAIARAKKAEDELKRLKGNPPEVSKESPPNHPASPQLNVEETVLLANGMSEELLEQLKKVAAVNSTSLIKAQNDPIFVAVKEKFEKEKKQDQASMPAARGSGQVKPRKTFNSPGLTADEHRAMVESLNK